MDMRELVSVLDHLRRLYAAGEAKAAKDLETLIECLARHESETIDDYLANLEAAVSAPRKGKAAATGSGRKSKATSEPNETLVGDYVKQLTELGTNEDMFARVFAALSAHPAIKLREADAIARQFTRHHIGFKTKKAALKAIQQTFVERARFQNKLRAVS